MPRVNITAFEGQRYTTSSQRSFSMEKTLRSDDSDDNGNGNGNGNENVR